MAGVECASWNPIDEEWTTEGCELVDDSNDDFVVCCCTHFTDFGVLLGSNAAGGGGGGGDGGGGGGGNGGGGSIWNWITITSLVLVGLAMLSLPIFMIIYHQWRKEDLNSKFREVSERLQGSTVHASQVSAADATI